jgi:hypothetical protein
MSGAKVYQVLGMSKEPLAGRRSHTDHSQKDAHIAPDCIPHIDAAILSTEGPIDPSDSGEEQPPAPAKSKGCCELL